MATASPTGRLARFWRVTCVSCSKQRDLDGDSRRECELALVSLGWAIHGRGRWIRYQCPDCSNSGRRSIAQRPMLDRDRALWEDHDNGMTHAALAKKYGISKGRAGQIARRWGRD